MSNDEMDQNGQDESGSAEESSYDASADGDAPMDESAYTGESKKPLSKGSLAMFVVLAAAGAGTYFMYARTGPQSAAAATDPKAQKVIKEYMSGRDKNFLAMQKMLRDTEAVVQQFLNYPSVKQIPLSALSANPFRLTDAAPDAAPRPDDAKEKKKREEERVAILKAVNDLQLQSVMSGGARKSCMVNNTLYTEGQQIEAFTIEKINANGIIVRNGSYRFELKMQR